MNDVLIGFDNEVRLKILVCLKQNPKNVSELINNCSLAQSAVSQHLSKLKQAGLVYSQKKGKKNYYYLKNKQAGQIAVEITKLLNKKQ